LLDFAYLTGWRRGSLAWESSGPAQEVTQEVRGKSRDQLKEKAKDGAFRLDNEPQAHPGRRAHQALDKGRPEPPAHAEREKRARREAW
jgi:hypothetical protein